jgi:RimJ/RimL family protein N-acetyltransferase
MIQPPQGIRLRPPEPGDVLSLYDVKNDREAARSLGGFSAGYSLEDVREWIARTRSREDELIWVIETAEGTCIGHCGFYGIDHRSRTADIGILIGGESNRGKGTGRKVVTSLVNYGFSELNLRRVGLSVLEGNTPARCLYESIGFVREGLLRGAVYKEGRYQDLVLMSILLEEWRPR